MSGQYSDQQLVERVQQGDKNAFNLLVMKYQNKVMSLIGRYVRNQADVQDVTQEAFIKAYRALANFRGDSAFYTWLYRIAVNTAKNYLTSQGRKAPGSDVDIEEAEYYEGSDALKEFASPERLLMKDQMSKVIFDTLETLPEELKIAISLRELDGMSYEDIANIMDCPVGTVRSRIFRAREAIDKQLQPLLEK
ncbi:RNA polymerase sigma factor RpoE [Shewanella sp. OMA3-2]|uniref:RNA polymerase sigma factor RpoE n=1 Tax=Shewanella sp. OMA3-2 TaxID=2908650 RepID=UPI001F014495|nr:RNA polymerase sigma factor RpoE [Shewanella sp. OMA3-2]UJF21457.1 RNA polymerase sigma factor RpoE [Shewanella sp. OMA3-2]